MSNLYKVGQELSAFAYEPLTVSSTALGPTLLTRAPAATSPATRAMCTVETDQVRFTYDGTTPTSTVGHLLNPGDQLIVEGIDNLKNLKFIRVTNDASVKVTYERYYRAI